MLRLSLPTPPPERLVSQRFLLEQTSERAGKKDSFDFLSVFIIWREDLSERESVVVTHLWELLRMRLRAPWRCSRE